MSGFIAMHRKIKEWRYYTDANTYRLFTHFLYSAAWKPVTWREIDLLPGQLITGRKVLASELRLSEQEIRTSIDKLKKGKEITIESTNKSSIITICKWEEYQFTETEKQPATQPVYQPTINQPATSQQPHTIKKEENKEKKMRTRDFIPPSVEEFTNYFTDNNYSKELAERAFKGYDVASWKDSSGKLIKCWKQKCQHVWFKPENKQLNGKKLQSESQLFKPLER